MGGKKNRTKWRKLSLGGDPSGEEASVPSPDSEFEDTGHAPYDDEELEDDVRQHNGDFYPENALSFIHDYGNHEGPPTLVFPNLGPLPIVGFSSQPPPLDGAPVVLPPPDLDQVNGQNEDPDGTQPPGVYVNGLWIPKSEVHKQYSGRNPACLVYHPIPWIRIRSPGNRGHHTRGIVPSDAHYRLYFSRRQTPPPPPHRGSWRSNRRDQQPLSPYLWCLAPQPQISSPPIFDDETAVQQQHPDLPLTAPPVVEDMQTQSSSSYVYPGYSFGPPVFTAPVLPLQSPVAGKSHSSGCPTPPTSETASSPGPTTAASPKKKKKKRRTKSRDAMDCASEDSSNGLSVDGEHPNTDPPVNTTPSPISAEVSGDVLHFADTFLQLTLCQAQQQLKQLKRDRLLNGYSGECLASLRKSNQSLLPTHNTSCDVTLVTPDGASPRSPVAKAQCLDSHMQMLPAQQDTSASVSPAVSPAAQPVSIVFTTDGDSGGECTATVEAYSETVAESILRDLTSGRPRPVVTSRSQLFLEGLENSYVYSGEPVNCIEQFSAQFVELAFREVYQNLGFAAISERKDSGLVDSGVFLEGFAADLLQNIFDSAREEFWINQNTCADCSSRDVPVAPSRIDMLGNEVPMSVSEEAVETALEDSSSQPSKSKALVHFLEQGFHAPSSETFDDESFHQEDELDDYVSRERYMEGDPALSNLSLYNQSETLLTDSEQELNTLQDKVRLTNQSIYKISYDEISYTDQSESEELEPTPMKQTNTSNQTSRSVSEEVEPVRFQPIRAFENRLWNEIPVHEAETASEAGSEDIELIPHRYESSASQEKHLYVNKLSLATELLLANENLPYDDDFKKIVEDQHTVEEGTVNLGFVCDESKVITSGPKAISRISAADSGVQSEESEDEAYPVKKSLPAKSNMPQDDNEQNEDSAKTEAGSNRPSRRAQPSLLPGAPVPPWCSLCCNVQ